MSNFTKETLGAQDDGSGWRMDPEVKELWAAALESGVYGQAKEVMWDQRGGYCCLGVLGELCGLAQGVELRDYDAMLMQVGAELPSEFVTEWAGFPPYVFDPILLIDGRFESAASHNDRGVPFGKIAKAVRKQL